MRVSCIVTSHNNSTGLDAILTQLEKQRLNPYEIILITSDTERSDLQKLDAWERCDTVIIQDNKSDWGHEKRALGLELALGDYVAFFNDDDTYSSKYLDKLAKVAEDRGVDIVGCDFVSHLMPDGVALTMPAIGHITSGNFIVRRELAQQVGYQHRHYEADGQFIEDLMAAGATFARVPEVLYVHN